MDDSCVYCNLCKLVAPMIFEEDRESGWAYVKKQPVSKDEIDLTYEALEGCPTESIFDREKRDPAVGFF